VFTDSPYIIEQAESHHRGHAIIEQVFADLIDGPLAHLPSGNIHANAAWLTLAAVAHNLTRAAGALSSFALAKARGHTIRRKIINVPAKIARHARTITLRLPPALALAGGMADPVRQHQHPAGTRLTLHTGHDLAADAGHTPHHTHRQQPEQAARPRAADPLCPRSAKCMS
jgi:hypothetical protein